MVIPDGLVVPERIDQGQYWIRRQRANEDVDGGASAARIRGKVACLLLYAVETNTKPLACVLLLTPREGETYERVGLGAHKMLGVTKSEMDSLGIVALSPSGPDYALGEDEKWEDWEEIGTWENWEEWFADAEVQTVRIV
ncbi:hypothetical protein PRZ48_014217 [Zasmidium cellare]|uniref:Uncharacterized protein n=1 Tax=Zasmidium cellare TaxID=395010 RepID=A0ABR0E0Y9_ZASCE|nr:hypothetical protein PRZ48_014217 [Zasmidium cellare]